MNYNDIPRVKPFYNTMNIKYNDNIPLALPLIRNKYFDHSNVTIAPPIPSYFNQNINTINNYSKLPNITYNSPENLEKRFINNLINLKNIEEQIREKNRMNKYSNYNISEINNNLSSQNKLENGNNEEEIKNKFYLMKQARGKIPDDRIEEQKRMNRNKELMSKEGMNKFNLNLLSSLSDYSNNIQQTIISKNNSDNNMYEILKKGIDSLKSDFSKKLDKFNNESKNNMEIMRRLIMNSSNPRLHLLSEYLFPTSEIEQIINLKGKKMIKSSSVADVRRTPKLMFDSAIKSREENDKNKREELLDIITYHNHNNSNNIIEDNRENIEIIPLDLWKKNRKKGIVIGENIKEKIYFYSQNYFNLQPLNKFRSYVFLVMASRRLLNIRYFLYKEFKFDSVRYYINNFEDMDIILKKLVYNTIKEPFLEILNNSQLNINLTFDNEDNHEVYYLLQDYIKRIMKGFYTKFFNGISSEILSYLSLYITNYSFIPKDFFTTFELVRFRTNETGEFIELDDDSRKMILIFYIFIKILLRNIFLELIFNQADRKKLSLNTKLNIKMLVSVLYRAIIKNLTKNCATKTNLDDLEKAEDMTAFLKLKYSKREFKSYRFLQKRYFLNKYQEEENTKELSKRTKYSNNSKINNKNEKKDKEEKTKNENINKKDKEKNDEKTNKQEENNKKENKNKKSKKEAKSRNQTGNGNGKGKQNSNENTGDNGDGSGSGEVVVEILM